MKKILKSLFIISGAFTLAFASSCEAHKGDNVSSSNQQESGQTSSSTSQSTSNNSSSSQQVTVSSILVATKPRVEYKLKEDFDPEGMTVYKVMSDGRSVTLESNEYTIEGPNRTAKVSGKYTVKVSLNEDPTIETSFDVEFLKPISVSVVPDCRTNYIKDEWVYGKDFNLEVKYSDNLKEIVNAYDYLESSSHLTETGDQEIEFEYTIWEAMEKHSYTAKLPVKVYDPADLTVKSFEMAKTPASSSFLIGSVSEVQNVVNKVRFVVEYNEIPNKTFDVYYNECHIDYSQITQATETGTYNVSVDYKNKNLIIPVSLHALSDYTISGFYLDTSTIEEKTFYVGEKIFDKYEFLNSLDIYAIYSKEGCEDISLQYAKRTDLAISADFSAIGKTKIKIYDPNDETKYVEYEVDVCATPRLEDGWYLTYRENKWEPSFEIKNGKYIYRPSFNGPVSYECDYSHMNRKIDQDGKTYFELIYFGESTIACQVYLNSDLSLMDLYKKGENDEFVVLNDNVRIAFEGKLNAEEEFEREIIFLVDRVMMPYYDIYNKKTNELITKDYIFTEDTEIELKFITKSGTGQPFLGTYSGNMQGKPYVLEIQADKIIATYEGETADMLYNYEIEDGKYKIIIEHGFFIIVDVATGKAQMYLDEIYDFTIVTE